MLNIEQHCGSFIENRKIDRPSVDYAIDVKSESGSKQNIFIKCDNDLSLNLKYQNKIVTYLLDALHYYSQLIRLSVKLDYRLPDTWLLKPVGTSFI